MQETVAHSNPPSVVDDQGKATNQAAKQPFVQPKLTFVQPKLIRQGTVNELTQWQGGFLDPGFSPPAP